jgi:PAS domain-containing protein
MIFTKEKPLKSSIQEIKSKIRCTYQSPMRENAFSETLPPQIPFNKNKQIDVKLKPEEKRFRAFVEHSSDIIVLVNRRGIISYINPAVENVLGFRPEERIGASGFELVHPDDKAFLAEAFNTLVKDV